VLPIALTRMMATGTRSAVHPPRNGKRDRAQAHLRPGPRSACKADTVLRLAGAKRR